MTKDLKIILDQINQYVFKDNVGIKAKSIEELNDFMRSIKCGIYDENFVKIFNQRYNAREKKQIGEYLLNIECKIEKETIKDYVEGSTAIIDEKLKRCTISMNKEGEALGVDAKSHVLLIGSGAMPISGVILYQHYKCKITCLDIDAEALSISQKWIEKLKIDCSFSFLNKDIFSLTEFSQYTHLIITGHISHKDTLLSYLCSHLDKQKLLVRHSIGLYQFVYNCASNFSSYKLVCMVDHGINMPYTSYILEAYGNLPSVSTPYYTFNLKEIEDNYNHMRRLLIACDKIFYALKANGEKRIIDFMSTYDIPFEVSSSGELSVVNNALGKSAEIICSLPVKSDEFITELYQSKCRYFVFDTWNEYEKLCNLAPTALKILRINITDISATAIDYGMTMKEFSENYAPADMKIDGVTFYNIPNTSIKQLTAALERCSHILLQLPQRPRILNIGGNYRFETDLEADFYHVLEQALLKLKNQMSDLVIYAEPGRTIVKSAGQLVTKVVALRKQNSFYEVYLDSGLPSGLLYPPKRISLLNPNRIPAPQYIPCKFFGITCSKKLLFEANLDFLPNEKDLLLLAEMGTYSICKANHFHGWELPNILFY